ncbi:MAG: spore germination protein [Bacilli bacterium]|nr:spore germination protein [Bacilli bacterium]
MTKAKTLIKKIKHLYGNSEDLCTRIIKIGKKNVGILYMESSSSTITISNQIIKALDFIKNDLNIFDNLYQNIKNKIFNSQISTTKNENELPFYLSSGFTIIIVDNEPEFIVLETRETLDRGITEATSEPILRGPKDSFTESHSKNLGLIRKRIKDPNLWFISAKVGRRTKTKVTIGYLNDVVDQALITEITNTLNKINVDGILDSGNIHEYLSKQSSSFPQILSTERPDLTCQAILNGKIVILVENSPFALLLPSVFTDFIHTSEDQFQKAANINFTRILKIISLFVTIFTPAIYIAITTFDQTVVPDKLLISLAVQREGVPFRTAFEIILLMTIFEVLRESDIRLPSNMGASMSIVGALVLGQAAVDAGIVSPIAVIIVAITSISSLIFSDADFINGIRTWRFIFIFAATFLGLTGIIAATLCFVLKLSSLETLGVSYLSPFSPLNISSQKDSIVRFPLPKLFKRPEYLNKKNIIKQGGINEK